MDLAWCLVCEKKIFDNQSLYCSSHCQLLDFQLPGVLPASELKSPQELSSPLPNFYEIKPCSSYNTTSCLSPKALHLLSFHQKVSLLKSSFKSAASFPPLLKRQYKRHYMVDV